MPRRSFRSSVHGDPYPVRRLGELRWKKNRGKDFSAALIAAQTFAPIFIERPPPLRLLRLPQPPLLQNLKLPLLLRLLRPRLQPLLHLQPQSRANTPESAPSASMPVRSPPAATPVKSLPAAAAVQSPPSTEPEAATPAAVFPLPQRSAYISDSCSC
nr:hypothetical protein Iba_chr01eCG1040 [Ipomoea batatas]